MRMLRSAAIALGQVMRTRRKQPTPESKSTEKNGKIAPIRFGAFGNHLLIQRFLYCEKCGAPLSCMQKANGRIDVNCAHICRPSQDWKSIEERGSRG